MVALKSKCKGNGLFFVSENQNVQTLPICWSASLTEVGWCCLNINQYNRDFAGGAVVKNPPANAGDTGSVPGPGRSHMPWSN